MPSNERGPRHLEVVIAAATVHLPGELTLPTPATGAVIFAHGSGSSRLSARNVQVAYTLNQAGLATLLFDLLTPGEARDRRKVFDVALLGSRLEAAHAWLAQQPEVSSLPVGYFGASTGAAAALWAAAEPDAGVAAIVSRGGRPDLAGRRLGAVRAPTLLIVGALDPPVLEVNRQARQSLRCPSELAIVAGATHLFEEPGTLEQVADLTRAWFLGHLGAAARSAA